MKTIYFFASSNQAMNYFLNLCLIPRSFSGYTLEGKVDTTPSLKVSGEFTEKDRDVLKNIDNFEEFQADKKIEFSKILSEQIKIPLDATPSELQQCFKLEGKKVLFLGNPFVDTILEGDCFLATKFISAFYFFEDFDTIYKFDDIFDFKNPSANLFKENINKTLQKTEGKSNLSLLKNISDLLKNLPALESEKTFDVFETFKIKKFSEQSLRDVYKINC